MQLQRVGQTRTAEAGRQRSPVSTAPPVSVPVHPILRLQQTIGNQAVQRLLRSRTIQAKLSISHPRDVYEQEADRVAEQVMRMPEPAVQRTCAPCAAGGASCPKCEAENEQLVQRKVEQVSDAGSSVPDDFVRDLGPGRPLDPATRAYFEPRFDYDFSNVRVHTDAKGGESARAVNALAYTVGQHIVFRPGQGTSETNEGWRLLAHELAHVIQQTSQSRGEAGLPGLKKIQRQDDGDEPPEKLPPTGSCECDCDSYCGYIAKQYAQAHITYPSWYGEEPRPIRLRLVGTACSYQREFPPCSWVCTADFESENNMQYRVIVQLMSSKRFNVGTVNKSFPLCSYDFECPPEGGLKLTELGCIEPNDR